MMLVFYVSRFLFLIQLAGAVYCGGFEAASCNLCYPDPTKIPASRSMRLSDFCTNDCELHEEGKCVISQKYKQEHLAKSQELLLDMAELTDHLAKALQTSFKTAQGDIPSLRRAIDAGQAAPNPT